MITGFAVLGPKEKLIVEVLEQFKRLCDKVLIVCNNCSDSDIDLVKSYGFEVKIDNRVWGKWQHKIKEDAVKTLSGWVIATDFDELFDKNFTKKDAEELAQKGGAGYYFYVCNLIDEGYSKKYSFWNIRMFNLEYGYEWKNKPLHCGLAPKIAYHYGNYAPFILKHYGLKDKSDRIRKVERYEKFDPNKEMTNPGYYEFLAHTGKPDEFNEDELHNLVANEVKTYAFKLPTKIMGQKYFYVKRLSDGKILDIPEKNITETLKDRNFVLITKEPVQEVGNFVKTTVSEPELINDIKESHDAAIEEGPKEGNSHICEECGFIAKTALGLINHKRKHI